MDSREALAGRFWPNGYGLYGNDRRFRGDHPDCSTKKVLASRSKEIKYNPLILFVLCISLPLQSKFYRFKTKKKIKFIINAYYTTVS